MQNLIGVFIGYKAIKSKAGKDLKIISLLFIETDEVNERVTYFVKDVFVNEEDYYDFIKNHSILESVEVQREIVGDTVRYYI